MVYDSLNVNYQIKTKATNIVKSANKSIITFNRIEDCDIVENAKYFQLELICKKDALKEYLNTFGSNLIMEENINGVKINYYYMPILSSYKVLKNKKVNLQVVFSNEKITVGYPMIYASF